MTNQATLEVRPYVEVINGAIKTNSIVVAENFGKRHNDVLRSIKNLDCSIEFHQRNFAQTVTERKNPSGGNPIKSPMYEITRDGFSFLAMGFTGKEAAKWKEAYINAFNEMERKLREQGPTWKSPVLRKPQANDKPLPKAIVQAIALHASTLSRRHYEDYHVVLQRIARWKMDVFDITGEDLIEALQQEDLGWVVYQEKPKPHPDKFNIALLQLTGSTQRRWLVVQRPGDAVSLEPIYPDQQIMSLDQARNQIAKNSDELRQLVEQVPADKLAVLLDAVTKQAAGRLRLLKP